MHSTQYSTLFREFPFENIDVVVETLDKYFSQLINLSVIEQGLQAGRKDGSYIQFFTRIISQLEAKDNLDLSTPELVANKIYEILHNDNQIRELFLQNLIFVPPLDGVASTQIGFQEKLATGHLKVPEAVTYFDMLRITFFLQTCHSRNINAQPNVAVLNLASIDISNSKQLLNNRNAVMINLNLNPKETPKWAVIELKTPRDDSLIYCENPILEKERAELEKRFGFPLQEVTRGTADYLISTGYTAIAWLDQNITKGWNFDTAADFNVLFGDYALTIFRMDVRGIHFGTINDEYDNDDYVTPSLKAIINHSYGSFRDPKPDEKRWASFGLYRMAGFATLGTIEGEEIPYNDLAKVIDVVGRHDLSQEQFEYYSNLGFRSKIPRFAHTLVDLKILIEGDDIVTLNVPENISYYSLSSSHRSSCAKTRTDADLLRFLKRDPKSITPKEEDIATGAVLTLFRCRAKVSKLNIQLPLKYQLNDQEHQMIVRLMQDNAYVTELQINEDNVSLRKLKDELLPVFARNRWLAENNYLPPFYDNYWMRAAKYWLLHLNAQENLLEERNEHKLFKQCVDEMGVRGLQAVLSYLSNPESSERLLNVYGAKRPAIYLSCLQSDTDRYLKLLITHLQSDLPFPFSKIGIAYRPKHDEAYFELIQYMNQTDAFENMQLTDCLIHQKDFEAFLQKLSIKAQQNGWTALIVIPELQDKKSMGEKYRELHSLYRQLNNVILHNRHLQQGANIAALIKEASIFDAELLEKKEEEIILPTTDKNDEPIVTMALFADEEKGPWPVARGGTTQLQMQQQQEIQQSRQVQQQNQKMTMHMLDQVITSKLVSYNSIDNLLSEYYARYKEENECDLASAPLWNQASETELQGFFHTWINANPNVKAPKIIRFMTQDAAKMLLNSHTKASSGFNLENLPKGFYVQRSKEGALILCYDPEIDPGLVTPLTPLLQVSQPQAQFWEGDFRLFNAEKYLHKVNKLETAEDFEDLVLFALLQPNKDYAKQFKSFCNEHPYIANQIKGNEAKVLKHWLVFFQAWQYKGADGVDAFLALNKHAFTLSSDRICERLFANQSPSIIEWVKEADFDLPALKAIGQAYYLNGDEPVALLLTKLRQVEVQLGKDFFKEFKDEVLARNENFNTFLTPAFFLAIDDVITKLSPQSAQTQRDAFLRFCSLHLQCVGWEPIETMWNAFDFFTKNLNDLGLEFEGNEFDDLEPQNMIVGADRILLSLRLLPGQSIQEHFLNNLSSLDLTQGGVHYAIQSEHFKFFDGELALHDFELGTPTYAPELSLIYEWEPAKASLNIKRILASRAQFSRNDYYFLSDELATAGNYELTQLILLIYTQYESGDISKTLASVRELSPEILDFLGHHIHQAIFDYGHEELNISLSALVKFKDLFANEDIQDLAKVYPHGNFLESLSILHESSQETRLVNVLQLFTHKFNADTCPQHLLNDGYKLATLFGANTVQLQEFIQISSNLKLAVQHELHLVIKHILSVNYHTTDHYALLNGENWQNLLDCIVEMNQHPSQRAIPRHRLIETYTARGINFKHSIAGNFRVLNTSDYPPSLNVFVDHQDRMWNFLKNHIVVPINEDAQESLRPVLAFFQRLQLNRTYLNEVEPLLAILEKTENHKVWSTSYFAQMIDALKADNDLVSFPLDMLQVMLQDEMLAAKPIDHVEKDFPKELSTALKNIIANTVFTRQQQAKLCRLLLKEYSLTKTSPLFNDTVSLLVADQHEASRDYALDNLLTCNHINELENRLEKLKKLLNHPRSSGRVNSKWELTSALWVKTIAELPEVEGLFNLTISSLSDDEAHRRSKILHIIAWSCLHQGLKSNETYRFELKAKAQKLIKALSNLSDDDLNLLVDCYPKQPAPGAGDLLNIIKKASGLSIKNDLQDFLCNPYPDVRPDYQQVALTRQSDLQRMLKETRLIDGAESHLLNAEQTGRISVMFALLKQLENGNNFVKGTSKPVSQLTQEEIAEAFHRLSKEAAQHGQNDVLQVQIWALLFEALGRTTRKYPHMAQQFALIANDLVIKAPTCVLQLATGEGKSHFVALRAARHAAQGNIVDVCTAKRTLAARDLEDYQEFFNYLNLTATYIEPKSSRETYIDDNNPNQGRIHYSTLGDLSLFLDEQSYHGHPINISPSRRIGLGDELDFIYFDEGRKTEYNYARPTGRTPKQMIWFYQAVNQFYKDHKEELLTNGITREIVNDKFISFLYETADQNEERSTLLNRLTRDGLQLVSWLQSAHEAHELVKGIGFTVREENIHVGDAAYLMKEIIPLSTDNQKVVGSTFSAGVHQLLATRLNTEAKEKGESQNYHVHPESYIMSSQVAAKQMSTLWGRWEGFTGTISYTQAQSLKQAQKTQVLQVSTNQRDLRYWHQPKFYKNEEHRINEMIKQLRACLQKKQSILFSCKNDQRVLWLQDELKKRLTRSELEHLIFYTNEDSESSADLLSRKQKMEDWRGGKKQKGIALMASGFSRGDNVGVDMVFLFDANDINDLRQKGGRTARNGEEGEVFQFYLTDEMNGELAHLKNIIKESPGVDFGILEKHLTLVKGASAEEKTFNQIMLLREFLFNLQNAANQGYRAGVAQFSGWGMELVGKFMDPTTGSEFANYLINRMRKLDKEWLQISSKPALTPTEKVRAIEKIIADMQEQLWEEFKTATQGNIADASFIELKPYPEITLSLTSPKTVAATPESNDIALLGSLVATFPYVATEQKRLTEFPKKLHQLNENADFLHAFVQDAVRYKTITQFFNQLDVRLSQLKQPLQGYKATLAKAKVTPTERGLFKGINSDVKEQFFNNMDKLTGELQEEVDKWLKKAGFITEKARISKVLPLVQYLASFSKEEQQHWGKDYLDQLDTIWLDTSAELVAARFSGRAMSYADNELIWRLATRYANTKNAGAVFRALQESVAHGSLIHRMRMLTRVETWLIRLPVEEQSVFLQAFANVMKQFHEGDNWDIFAKLVDKTAQHWDQRDGRYRPVLSYVWQELAKRDFAKMKSVLMDGLEQPGTSWFNALERSFSLPEKNADALSSAHWQKLNHIFINKQGLGKYFNAERRKEVFVSLNQLLDAWSEHSAFNNKFSYALETLSLFLQSAKDKDKPENMDMTKATCWYFDCLRLKPEVRDALDQLVANPERALSLNSVVAEFGIYAMNAWQESTLLRIASEGKLNKQAFSLCCHAMAALGEVLEKTSLLSQEEKTQISKALTTYPADKLIALLNGMKDYPEALRANPRVLLTFLPYAKDKHLDANRVGQLASVLLHVVGTTTQIPPYFAHLVNGVNRFQDTKKYTPQDLNRLQIILKGDDALPVEQVLFDNVAMYLESKVNKGQQQAAKRTIDLFYSLAKEHRGDVSRMFNLAKSAELKEMFDFKTQNKSTRVQRVLWMHLLNQDAFVTGAGVNEELDSHKYQWSQAQNEDMLKHGLNCYLAETKELLAQKPRARLGLDRDLSHHQQLGLLHLANELALIGKPQLSAVKFSDIQVVKTDLAKLTSNYQSGWFKSQSREKQIKSLQTAIETELQYETSSNKAISRYEVLLKHIQQARVTAMREDVVENKTRRLKLNRSGHSRYFSTLNQMEDLIVRHWVNDMKAVQHFQSYSTLTKQEVLELSKEFHSALSEYCETAKAAEEARLKKTQWMRNWVVRSDKVAVLQNLCDSLHRFNQNNTADTLNDVSLNAMTVQLKENLSRLPGHLKTLAKEVAMRSEALGVHLSQQMDHPANPVINRSGRL
jgi:hypothetical protein